jgi:hypothetical protein
MDRDEAMRRGKHAARTLDQALYPPMLTEDYMDALVAAVVDAIHPDEYEPCGWLHRAYGECIPVPHANMDTRYWRLVYVKREPAAARGDVAATWDDYWANPLTVAVPAAPEPDRCPTCDGSGMYRHGIGAMRWETPCSRCRGTGVIKRCPTCGSRDKAKCGHGLPNTVCCPDPFHDGTGTEGAA